jgi:hypothetical protein
MRNLIILIEATIVSLVILSQMALAQTRIKLVTTEESCIPIARILSSGDRKFPPRSQLCENDVINPISGEVNVLCYLNGRILSLVKGSVGKQCLPLSSSIHSCNTDTRSSCLNLRGVESVNSYSLRLITPYGILISDSRPTLSWTTVNEATSYTVQVQGNGVSWSVDTKNSRLEYPPNQPPLQLANVYKISIIANQGEDPIIATSTMVMLPPASKLVQIAVFFKELQKYNLNGDDFAIDTAEIYRSQGLLDTGVKTLQDRIKAGSQNPIVFQILNDFSHNEGKINSPQSLSESEK